MNRSTFLSLLFFVGFAFISVAAAADETTKDFTLPSATENTLIRLSDHRGKVVLINWWRSSCSICDGEMPKLKKLYQKYHGQGLEIIGVSDDNGDSVQNVPAFLAKHKITWPVGLNDQGEFMHEIRPKGSGSTPCNYLVSRSGKLTFLGLMRNPDNDLQKIEQAIQAALKEPTPTEPAIAVRKPNTASFELKDLAGKSHKMTDFAGKPLVVTFFNRSSGSWAGAVFTKLQDEYGPRGLQVVGIHLYGNEEQVRDYIKKYDVNYPVLAGDKATQKEWIGSYRGWATFFVSADGTIEKKITKSIVNGIEEPVFRKYAELLLTQQETSGETTKSDD